MFINFDFFLVLQYHGQNLTLSWNGQNLVKFRWNMTETVSLSCRALSYKALTSLSLTESVDSELSWRTVFDLFCLRFFRTTVSNKDKVHLIFSSDLSWRENVVITLSLFCRNGLV